MLAGGIVKSTLAISGFHRTISRPSQGLKIFGSIYFSKSDVKATHPTVHVCRYLLQFIHVAEGHNPSAGARKKGSEYKILPQRLLGFSIDPFATFIHDPYPIICIGK